MEAFHGCLIGGIFVVEARDETRLVAFGRFDGGKTNLDEAVHQGERFSASAHQARQ